MKRKVKNLISVLWSLARFSMLKLWKGKAFSFWPVERFSPNTRIDLRRGSLRLGKRVRVHHDTKLVIDGGRLELGDDVAINDSCGLYCFEGITVGARTEFGPMVMVYDHDHDIHCPGGLKAGQYRKAPVIIGENVWVGAHTVILRGTTIGDNSVIGAGSVVCGEVPADTVLVQKRSQGSCPCKEVRMRILHVVANLWRCNGVMSVVMNYLRNMPEDIRFDVMYFDELSDNYRAEIEALGGRTVKISPPGLHSFCRDDVDAYLRDHWGEYAAIHIHLPYLASLLAPKARRAGISKVYVHCHSTWFSLKPRNNLRNQMFNLPTRALADQMFACGREAGTFWYGKRAMERGRVKVLPNAIVCDDYRFSAERRRQTRAELGLTGELVVGHVGRVSPPQKNHPFLLRVFAAIHRKRPDSVLLLVGAEPNEELTALAGELGIQLAIRWLGLRADVADLLQAMDVFIFPSFYEGLPVAVVEAESAGLPVVMSDAVTDEVCVTDQSVRLPLTMDPEDWAERALALCGEVRVDSADRVVAAGFDLKTSAAWLEEFYRS